MQAALSDRFWSKVDRSAGPDGCWPWTAAKAHGYGRFQVSRARGVDGAHRLSYAAKHGPIPAGMCVLHRCDVPACVNPAHLFLGSHGDNVVDKMAKGRSRTGVSSGSRNGRARLTETDVLAIRAKCQNGAAKTDLAKRYGVSDCTVGLIVRRETWTHV